MSFVLSKGKFPKKPQEGKYLEICSKDFRDFKKEGPTPLLEYLSSIVKQTEENDKKSNMIELQKQNLREVAELIKKGKESVAFSLFFRTFPYCAPHRNRFY
ncbi:MAG: hypothetical protein ACFE85_16090 [Candidatus Hodarchaeota archaeon]